MIINQHHYTIINLAGLHSLPFLFPFNMVKRTLCFSNPAYLSLKQQQLEIKLPEVEKSNLTEKMKFDSVRTFPIEDIGIVILDNRQITITQALLASLLNNNCSVITCNDNHLPTGLFLNLDGNTLQSERFQEQISASLPLKKQLWQQTIMCKITNQASLLKRRNGCEVANMNKWALSVKSGDTDNMEARAAVYYWKNLFPENPSFVRERTELGPNALFNYGYSILRAVIARSLVASGLLPTLGIHHHNKYNAYCLADDIMEPYRPYVDEVVLGIINSGIYQDTITTEIKKILLGIPVVEVNIDGYRSPLMIAAGQTTASLSKCFAGETRKLLYPIMD